MEKNVNFKNPETNNEIQIDIGNEITYIYGGNGTGKTSFSKLLKDEVKNSLVFNIDFINRNLFVVDTNGTKDDTNTKENLTQILIDSQQIEEKIKLESLLEKIHSNKSELQTAEKSLKEEFQKVNLNVYQEVSLESIKGMFELNYDPELENEQNLKNLRFNTKLETTIESDKMMLEQIKLINEEANVNLALNEIKSDEQLNELINNKAKLYNNFFKSNLLKFNNNLHGIIEFEKSFSLHSEKNSVFEWIKKGISLHEGQTDCLFCRNKDIEEQINDWKEKIENDLSVLKQEIKDKISLIKRSCLKFLEQKIYIQYFPKIRESLEEVHSLICYWEKNIDKNKTTEFKKMEISKDDILLNNQTKISNVQNYILNKDLNLFFGGKILESKMLKRKDELEKIIDQFYDTYRQGLDTQLNEVLSILGFAKEMKFNLDKKSKKTKLSLKIDGNRSLNTLSEGQKHKIALAVFFVQLVNSSKDKPVEYLVLDDPVATLDIYTYHALRSYLINNISESYTNIIILTHNFNFLLMMISNLNENETLRKKTNVFYLQNDKCEKRELSELTDDDICIFIKTFYNITSLNDLSIWSWTIFKIFRLVLNMKLALMGVNTYKTPEEDINKIFSGKTELDRAQEIRKSLNDFYNNDNTVNDIKNHLYELLELCEMLNLNISLDQEKIKEKFKLFNGKDKLIAFDTLKAKDFYFEILLEGLKIVKRQNNLSKTLKNYLLHPKNQITNTLIAIYTQRDI